MDRARGVIAGGALPLLMWIPSGWAGESVLTDEGARTASTVDELVEAFFRLDDVPERRRLAHAIERAAGGSRAVVARAVRDARLWPAMSSPQGVFVPEAGSSRSVRVAYQIPSGYDPARRYPLILCMPDDAGSPADALALAGMVLGEAVDGFALVCPEVPVGGSFAGPGAESADLVAVMRQVRQRIHVDTDRVFAFGYGKAGEAAWMITLMHSDLFAGAIVLSAHPRVPYPEQVYPFLLDNLRFVPVLTGWPSGAGQTITRQAEVAAAHQRAIVAFAEQVALPIIGVEMDVPLPETAPSFQAEASRLLTRRRGDPRRTVGHWFRYPAQGRAEWIVQTKARGELWEAGQLSILPSPATDRDAFISGVVKDRMAYIGGRIDGQIIALETRRCARVDLMLPDGLLDWDEPVTVRCNGKTRHHGPIRPSIGTLLAAAYDQWEFQRLVAARVSFSIRTDAAPK